MAKLESAVSPLAGPAPAPFGPGAPGHGQLVTKERIRLVIAEGHQIVRLGLERFLGSIEDFTVVATSTDGQSRWRQCVRTRPMSSSWTSGCRARAGSKSRAIF